MLIYRYRTGATGRSVQILKLLWDRVPSAPSGWACLQIGNVKGGFYPNARQHYAGWLIPCFRLLGVFKLLDDDFEDKWSIFSNTSSKIPHVSAFRLNFLTFPFRLWGVVRIPILDWWSSSQLSSRDPVRSWAPKIYIPVYEKNNFHIYLFMHFLCCYGVSCNSVYLCWWSRDQASSGWIKHASWSMTTLEGLA